MEGCPWCLGWWTSCGKRKRLDFIHLAQPIKPYYTIPSYWNLSEPEHPIREQIKEGLSLRGASRVWSYQFVLFSYLIEEGRAKKPCLPLLFIIEFNLLLSVNELTKGLVHRVWWISIEGVKSVCLVDCQWFGILWTNGSAKPFLWH